MIRPIVKTVLRTMSAQRTPTLRCLSTAEINMEPHIGQRNTHRHQEVGQTVRIVAFNVEHLQPKRMNQFGDLVKNHVNESTIVHKKYLKSKLLLHERLMYFIAMQNVLAAKREAERNAAAKNDEMESTLKEENVVLPSG